MPKQIIEQDDLTLTIKDDSVEVVSKAPHHPDTLSLPYWAFEPLTYEQTINLARLFLAVHYGAKTGAGKKGDQ